jgi:hypothetical protein
MVRACCGGGGLLAAGELPEMSVSPHRCRKNEAQGLPLVPREFIFSKCAFRLSGSAILFQNLRFPLGILQF